MLGAHNVLFLDEPTNHLDIPAKETLEDALRHFDGTVFVVSHDRYFVSQVADLRGKRPSVRVGPSDLETRPARPK